MGNQLYVDDKASSVEDILAFDMENLNNVVVENDKEGFQNLKVWRFYQNESEEIKSEAVLLPNIQEDHFLLSSLESYIVLLIYKGKEDITDISAFPSSLWGIIESSTNMTPRGLKYAFSTYSEKAENLESFLLSKRDFKNSDFKFVLFIWNGKKCTPALKSNVLMKAFDLDKKLSADAFIPYLYYGYSIKDNQVEKGGVLKLNDIIKNTVENLSDDNLLTPSTESFCNYHETVYLLHWLYPLEKKTEKKSPNKIPKRPLFPKFNSNFLNMTTTQSDFYDLFVPLEKTRKNVNKEEAHDYTKSKYDNEDYEMEDLDEDSLNSNDSEEDKEFDDIVDDIDFVTSNIINKISNNIEETDTSTIKKSSTLSLNSNKLKINLGDIHNNTKTNTSTDTDNNSSKMKEVKVPKLNMTFQHKVLDDDKISQRTKQITEDEENLDSLESHTIRKASEIILKKENNTAFNKLDLKNLDKKKESFSPKQILKSKTNSFNLNLKMNLKEMDKEEKSDKNNDDYDLKESDRKKVVMDYFSKTMSEIEENFLFISGYNVAKNKEIVMENKITHMINAAADVCQNHFEGDISYLSFSLKDHSMENIECLFYEVIHFIEEARSKKGRILVHCIQGISRSVTLVIAYLIFSKKLNYDEAFKLVQSKRSIASPNLGFSIQLQNFYQRLYEPPQTFRLYPKIISVGSFQAEQPEKIVCRLTQEQFFEQRINNTMRVFDKRGVYIIVTLDCVYLWTGSKIYSNVRSHYISAARAYIPNLQKYEKAPSEVIEIKEGNETDEFLKIWFSTKEKLENFNRNRFSEIVNECNNWYKDVDITSRISSLQKEKSIEQSLNKDAKESKVLVKTRKAFYIYPDEDKPENIIDLDDLGEDDFFVAFYEDKNESKFMVYIWKGSSVDVDPEESNEYVEKIKSKFFSKEDIEKVVINEEVPYNESDEFMNML